jgi:L-threonylcarbamoyladenylate synthase
MAIGTDVDKAAHHLRQGDIVAIPTETVYGLAANALDPEAVLRVFEAKHRPAFDPLIVHVGEHAGANDVVREMRPEARSLIDHFWPGPLTLVLPKRDVVPDIVTSGLDTVGVRMPSHPLTLDLLRRLDFPLAAPSANPFGYISPTTAQHVADQLGEQVPYILDGGPCAVGIESTIIGWEGDTCVLYRAGGVPVEAIEAVIGTVRGAAPHVLPAAPGMLESHYAPRTPLHVGDVQALLRQRQGERMAVISFTQQYEAWRSVQLSPRGDLHEAARNLFTVLRELDRSGADVILAERFPEHGLGRAINDRLSRAAAERR